MPALVLGRLTAFGSLLVIDVPLELTKHYAPLFSDIAQSTRIEVRAHIARIYSDEGRVIDELNTLEVLPIVRRGLTPYIDVSKPLLPRGIPAGYWVEAVLLSLRLTREGRDKVEEYTLYPNELKVFIKAAAPRKVREQASLRITSLEKASMEGETVSLLYTAELYDEAADLYEAITRFHQGDYEGTVKFSRRVIEALRNRARQGHLDFLGEKRAKFLEEYLTKAFQLISNFGEHAGTHATALEAELAKNIAASTAKYIAQHLKSQVQSVAEE